MLFLLFCGKTWRALCVLTSKKVLPHNWKSDKKENNLNTWILYCLDCLFAISRIWILLYLCLGIVLMSVLCASTSTSYYVSKQSAHSVLVFDASLLTFLMKVASEVVILRNLAQSDLRSRLYLFITSCLIVALMLCRDGLSITFPWFVIGDENGCRKWVCGYVIVLV